MLWVWSLWDSAIIRFAALRLVDVLSCDWLGVFTQLYLVSVAPFPGTCPACPTHPHSHWQYHDSPSRFSLQRRPLLVSSCRQPNGCRDQESSTLQSHTACLIKYAGGLWSAEWAPACMHTCLSGISLLAEVIRSRRVKPTCNLSSLLLSIYLPSNQTPPPHAAGQLIP